MSINEGTLRKGRRGPVKPWDNDIESDIKKRTLRVMLTLVKTLKNFYIQREHLDLESE